MPPAETPTPIAPQAAAEKLDAARLLRRVSLDLVGRLPTTEERTAMAEGTLVLGDFIDTYAADAEVAATLAEAHRLIWRLNGRQLPDLDRFVAAGNTSLSAQLTRPNRAKIAGEAILHVRRMISAGGSYGDIFTHDEAVADDAILALWGLTPGAAPWTDESISEASYTDSRPSAGILASQGFWASFSSEEQDGSPSRLANVLARLTCINLESKAAHSFLELSPEQVTTAATTAGTAPGCASCHNQFDRLGGVTAGLAAPTNFSAWLAYTAPPGATTFYFAGQPVKSLSELSTALSKDARVLNCTARGLYSALQHRPVFNDSDIKSLTYAQRIFQDANFDIRSLASALVRTEDYALAPLGKSAASERAARSSGLRFLSRRHFLGLLKQLSAESGTLEVPEEVDPGSEEIAGTTFRSPTGTYWFYVNRLARQAATLIITSELATDATVDTRRLFLSMPDGTGAGAEAAVVKTQIIDTWKFLTSQELAADSPKVKSLVGIFEAAGGNTDDTASQTSWTAVLLAMFLSPEFLTY